MPEREGLPEPRRSELPSDGRYLGCGLLGVFGVGLLVLALVFLFVGFVESIGAPEGEEPDSLARSLGGPVLVTAVVVLLVAVIAAITRWVLDTPAGSDPGPRSNRTRVRRGPEDAVRRRALGRLAVLVLVMIIVVAIWLVTT
jgi:hypothetical protein